MGFPRTVPLWRGASSEERPSLSASSTFFPAPAASRRRWTGDYILLVQNLILKDFRIRYRNMSLGVFWSLLNPLVLMGVMWFVFTKIYPNARHPHFAVFVLCGLVPYNFFAIAWVGGTTSLVDNSPLMKRLPVPRFIIPIASVLGNVVHLSAQIGLLLLLNFFTYGLNRYWPLLAFVWLCEVMFVSGISLIFSCLNVYIRDIRYVVESANMVLFWLVPIFYPFEAIAPQFREIYQFNPVAALVLASRQILMEATAPPVSLLVKLAGSSTVMLLLGLLVFRKMESRFYNYL